MYSLYVCRFTKKLASIAENLSVIKIGRGAIAAISAAESAKGTRLGAIMYDVTHPVYALTSTTA